jgi:hypothetical protein
MEDQEREPLIPGGRTDLPDPSEVDQDELARGIEVEHEHTTDDGVAQEIALAHLAEMPDYYTRLDAMEQAGKSGKEDTMEKQSAVRRRRGSQPQDDEGMNEGAVRSQMAEALDADPGDLEVSEWNAGFGVQGWEVRLGQQQYLVFMEQDDAHAAAVAMVRQDLEDEPKIFNQSWLQGHLSMSETDARLLAQDLVGEYPDEIEPERVWDELGEDPEDPDDLEVGLDDARERLGSNMIDAAEQELDRDPVGYLVEDQGIYRDVGEIMKAGLLRIDLDEAAEDAVRQDGEGHFISHYDGMENETSAGMLYYRTN